ncbi:MAG: hypothetical protein J7598_20535 [Mitsuaria chitosanitabida]|jgi:hypothetical protein|uniref:hypothetical protein n=1 Tax=Roseateles chitosanitabidus TaxID=65048 RepID=UPI001B202B5F|nr:hypothetical protein [Roseateles chitosanitabidus]MBO9688997.1 hypothetical protein [Roseateles chitosanitabidus]
MSDAAPRPTVLQIRRLRQLWRSAGWPCQDMLEVELLALGWLERRLDPQGRETLHLTTPGIEVLHLGLRKNRAARDRHEDLVTRTARELQRAGRVVWRGLSLRAGLPREDEPERLKWVHAMPDVYSVRNTTVEDYLEPAVHEIKVSRADLLAELRRPAKAQAYLALSGQCWYVLRAGIATVAEIPPAFGVLFAHELAGGDGLRFELGRPAPRRAMRPDFATWMALAKATPEPPPLDEGQDLLGEA